MIDQQAAPVHLRIATQPGQLRFARVTAATLAGDLPFTLRAIEDLRVAVDELAAAAIDGCEADDDLLLTFTVDGDAVVVEGRVAGAGEAPELHPVAADLLELLADHYELGVDNGDRVFRLTKRPRSIDE